MNIIFDEYKYACQLLDGYPNVEKINDILQPTKYFDWRDCFILAKYFRSEGLKNKKIKERITDYLSKNNISYNEVRMGESLDRAIRKSKLQELRVVKEVRVTELELKNIRSIKSYQMQKILFVMLVIAKAMRISNHYKGTDFILAFKFASVLRMAKIYVNRSEADGYKTKLHSLGYIHSLEPGRRMLSKGVELFKLLYVDNNDPLSPTAILVNDLDNIVNFIPFVCLECGKEIKQPGHGKKYCDECSKKLKVH